MDVGTKRPPYSYHELAQLASLASTRAAYHNAYAVVAECSVPRRSQGSDFVCNLQLMDASIDGGHALELLIFAQVPEMLPKASSGDIIRLHRVKVQQFNGRPQLVGKVVSGTRGAPFSFCLFDSDVNADTQPYQVSSASFYWDGREASIVRALREYVAVSGAYELAPRNEYVKPIRDLRPYSYADMVVKVLAYGMTDVMNPPCQVMFVWDGTDAVPYSYRYFSVLDEQDLSEEKRKQLMEQAALLAPPQQFPDGSKVVLPKLGTVLPVLIQRQKNVPLGSEALPAVGTWVKLRKIRVRVAHGQMQGNYTPSSKWMPWRKEEEAMKAYQHRLEHNEVAGWAPPERERLVALSRHPTRPATTIRQIKEEADAGAPPRRYRVLVRVADYLPEEPAEMCRTAEECGLGQGGGGDSGYVYTIKLLLEDATGQLEAILFGADAVDFFCGITATDLKADPEAAERVKGMLEWIRGLGNMGQNGHWMEVCLKAYDIEDPPAPSERRQYMIFDTVIHASEERGGRLAEMMKGGRPPLSP